jgi:predicted metalloprotease
MADWGKILSRGNVDDRRGQTSTVVGGVTLTGVALVVIYNLATGGSTQDVLQGLLDLQANSPSAMTTERDTTQFAGQDSYEIFTSTVLGSNNDVWQQKLTSYHEPKLVLFRNATPSGCGTATSAVGPHYCPADETIYLDETFFDELTKRFGAKGGDVAQGYVIAHEVGHHVQNLVGTLAKIQSLETRYPSKANALSVQQELQADCYAGIWANSLKGKNILEQNEISEAIDAAEAVGDDRIQEAMTGQVHKESWTHGSSEDRKRWFETGFSSGDIKSCNTFAENLQ